MYLSDLLGDHLTIDAAPGQLEITGLSHDSRRAAAGHLFFAIAGSHADGRAYAKAAIAAGAVAIITDMRPLEGDVADAHAAGTPVVQCDNPRLMEAIAASRFWPKQPGMMAAVTGTNGKTSTVEFLRQIWKRVTWDAASIGTLGVNGTDTRKLAGKMLELPPLTTPDSISLHHVLHDMAGAGVTHLALEASSHGLEQHRMDQLQIHVAAFTNLTRDHLDHHPDIDAYFDAKARLFTEILMHAGAAIINIDDDYGRKLADRLRAHDGGHVITTFGWDAAADVRIDALEAIGNGLLMSVTFGNHSVKIPLALSATFQAVNALTAAIMAHHSGLALHDSLGAMPYLKPAPGRMQTVTGHPDGARVVVDYAHTPDALAAALEALRPETKGKLAVLFGCGGDRDKGKREMMGKIAAERADIVYVTDDNPRSEDAATIRAAIVSGAPAATNIDGRDAAISLAIKNLRGDDVLLIAGKGHETVQLIGNETLPFSDASVAQHVIAGLVAQAAHTDQGDGA